MYLIYDIFYSPVERASHAPSTYERFPGVTDLGAKIDDSHVGSNNAVRPLIVSSNFKSTPTYPPSHNSYKYSLICICLEKPYL